VPRWSVWRILHGVRGDAWCFLGISADPDLARGVLRGWGMTHHELYERIANHASRIVQFIGPLVDRRQTEDIAAQLLRSATSSAANYRAAGVGRSHREFRAKLGLALEEADETLHWLDFLDRSGLASGPDLDALLAEAREITAILGASRRTANRNADRTSRHSGKPDRPGPRPSHRQSTRRPPPPTRDR